MIAVYGVLALSALASGVGLVAQTAAAGHTEQRDGVDPGLLARLAADPIYLLGFGAQVIGFVLAFLARGSLPLYIVQAGSSAAVGVAALLGFAMLGWRLGRRDLVALLVLLGGLVLLVGAAKPSVITDTPASLGWALLGALAGTALLAVPATRLSGTRGALALGALAGAAFAVVAVAARPIAARPLWEIPLEPLAWLVVAAAVLGQALLAGALQRGAATPAAAAMDASTTVLAAAVGLVVLGDEIASGRAWWVAVGLVLVVAAVVVMATSRRGEPGEPRIRWWRRSDPSPGVIV